MYVSRLLCFGIESIKTMFNFYNNVVTYELLTASFVPETQLRM